MNFDFVWNFNANPNGTRARRVYVWVEVYALIFNDLLFYLFAGHLESNVRSQHNECSVWIRSQTNEFNERKKGTVDFVITCIICWSSRSTKFRNRRRRWSRWWCWWSSKNRCECFVKDMVIAFLSNKYTHFIIINGHFGQSMLRCLNNCCLTNTFLYF